MPAGLQDNNARDYSPATGRFISADPAGAAGSGTNLYQYAGGDPVDYSDPSGLFIAPIVGGCLIGGLTKDLIGALAGRKHSLGDFASGFLTGCAEGALFALGGELIGAATGAIFGTGGLLGALADVIGGASEAESALEGGLSSAGIDGAEATTGLGDSLGDDIPCAVNSFAGNTLVKLSDGTTEQISKLKPGEKVLATDPATGKTSTQPILAVIHGHKTEHLAKVTIAVGGGHNRRTGVITATAGHPFYDLTQHGWVPAGNLHPGDRLDTLSHARAVVVAIGHYDQQATAWNLTIGTNHTYYVVTAGTPVLVHNGCGEDLIDGQAQEHIISGDATGGGHKWPGAPGQSPFPPSWDTGTILDNIAEVATNPNSTWQWQTGAPGSLYTNAGNPSRVAIQGVIDNVLIKVIYEPATGRIVTGFPPGG